MKKLFLASVAGVGMTLAMNSAANAQALKPVAPGTVEVHLRGYFQYELANYGSSVNTITTKGNTVTPGGTYKLNPVTTDGDLRLYPGFDAQTLNGLNYGVAVELRTGSTDASVGAGKSSSSGLEGLYVNHAYGYLGTKEAGYIRMGQTDSAFILGQAGLLVAFGDGTQFFTDGGEKSLLPTIPTPNNFVEAYTAVLYSTDKIVYISPSYAGFNGIIGYEPNSNGLKEGYNNNAAASSTSAALSSSPVAADIGKRRKNTVDAMVQYLQTINGITYKVSGGYMVSSPVSYTGGTPISAAPYGYDDLGIFHFGAQMKVGGLLFGANIKGGAVEDSYQFKPKGARNGFTYIVDAIYTHGPWVGGFSFFDGQTSGAYVPGKKNIAPTLSEYGLAIGGNYVLNTHLNLWTQYEYGHRHQPGASYALSGTSGAATIQRNNLQVQAIATGATFTW